jgi:hypothetical protein
MVAKFFRFLDFISSIRYLLSSLIRSLDCGFRYEFVVGYDIGDPFYDTPEVGSLLCRWACFNCLVLSGFLVLLWRCNENHSYMFIEIMKWYSFF